MNFMYISLTKPYLKIKHCSLNMGCKISTYFLFILLNIFLTQLSMCNLTIYR